MLDSCNVTLCVWHTTAADLRTGMRPSGTGQKTLLCACSGCLSQQWRKYSPATLIRMPFGAQILVKQVKQVDGPSEALSFVFACCVRG